MWYVEWKTWMMLAIPITGVALALATWGSTQSVLLAVVLAVFHMVLVLVSVGHAEAIAHRIGEPLGTLILALSVTVIEVSLVVTMMITEGDKAATLARDTVFAAIMIVCNGVVGLSILVRAQQAKVVQFSEQGANALLGTVLTIATLSLVLPNFTSSSEGATFTGSQFAFSAVSAFIVYAIFIVVQTRSHRWMFLSPEALSDEIDDKHSDASEHHEIVGKNDSIVWRTVMLVLGLAGVVGLAKTLSPQIESAVEWFGAPQAFVGVVIALMILLPETIAALRAAKRSEMQTSLNLSLGSALASIGLTIPAIAIASIWLDGPIVLGLGPKEIVLLALTAVVSGLTFGSGQATLLQGVQHLAIFAAFIFLTLVP